MSNTVNENKAVNSIVLGLLGILFIGLKLTGHINWSWWWVTAPFWAPWAIIFAVAGIAIIAGVILNALDR